MTALDIDACMQNSGLIRHRAKLEAIVKNAKAYLAMEKCGENFSNFIWSFVNHKPIVNDVPDLRSVPTKTEVSKALSQALKKNVVSSLLAKPRAMRLCNLWGWWTII